MSKFWSSVVSTLTPYVPGEQPKIADLVKLNTNENPYPPSPTVIKAIIDELQKEGERLRLYPDPEAQVFKEAICHYHAEHGIVSDQVFVGNGSDEVLALIFQALLKHEAPVLLPDISYSFYPVYCGLYEIEFQKIALGEDFNIHVEDYARQNGGIVIANPNAPTGIAINLPEIERLAAAHPDSVVVIDEAYVDFGAQTAIPLVKKYANLLIVRTLSKSHALAGLRAGYAIGNHELIKGLERVKDSFNSYPLDRLAIVGASAALKDTDYLEKTRQAVMASRARLVEELCELGFDVLPSTANFIFARHPREDATTLAAKLREKKIIVRHFKQARIDQFLRISIGTDAQCRLLIDAIRQIIG